MRFWFYLPSFILFGVALVLAIRLARRRPYSDATVDAWNFIPWIILTWLYCGAWLVSAAISGSTAGSDVWASWASAVRLSGSILVALFMWRKLQRA